MSDAAERQRARRRELNKRASGSQSGGLASTLFEGAAMATGAFYGSAMLYRQGLGPTIERGLAFGSRFLSGMSERGTSKALEDWTISDARKLWKDSREVFWETQRSMRENPLVLDPSDNRTLFSVMSEFSQGRGRGSDAMFGRMWRQEGLINPTLDLYAQQASKWGHSENEQLRFQSFIKTVASSIHNEVAVDRIARDAFGKGTPLRKQADFFTEHLRKLDQDKKAKDAMKDRVSEGYKNLRKTAMDLDALERNQKRNRGGFLQRLWDSVSGTRAVTNRDIINNQNLVKSIKYQKQGPNGKIITKDPIQDILTAQKYWREHDKKHGTNFEERFLNLAPDVNGLRVDANGKFYSGEGSRKFFDNLTSSLANTLPGKILKMRAINQARMAPQFIEIAQGSRDPILAALTNSDKNKKSPYVDSSLFRIHGNYFRMDEKGGLENLGDLGGTHLIHGRYGATQHLLHQMEGSTRYKQGTNWFTRTFDLFQDRSEFGGSPLEGFRAMAEKSHDENYIGNIIEYWKNPTEENNIHFFGMTRADGSINKDRVMDVLCKADKFHDFLSSTVREFDQDSARKMAAAVAPDSVAKSLFEALGTGSQEKIEEAILAMNPNKILSEDLANIANRLRSNRGSVYGTVIQKESGGRQHIGSNLADLVSTDYGNETMDGLKKMQVALGKEAILQTTTVEKGGKVNYQAAFDIIDAANLGMRETEEAKRLAHLARFEYITRMQGFRDEADEYQQLSNLHKMALDVRYAVTGSGSEKKEAIIEDFQDTIGNIKSEYINWQTKHYSEPDEIGNPIKYNEWVTMRDVVGPLDILKNLNDWTKTKATAKQFVKQFGAGRDNLGDVSEATLTPYFFLSRLSDDMNKVGLGFSKDNMGSTLDIAKAIMTKRVLPLWIGGTYYEWLDDTSQEVTGMSVSGAAAQGLANTDIALRKTMDIFGITDWMKGEKAINPIMQYWGDHNEFMDSDELRDWYANGYEPVRKGAWWTFGGVNEARGSEIAYWQPNFVRRIQSDYKDKALYDGYFDKWSHSLIPTPSNPLSPLMAILDPYWLEEKHKDDRPYELTGHMFEDGTPWGAILNPTIGEIIKPQKSLHTFLGFDYRNINGVDPKSLLHAINMNIKQRAADWGHRNYIQLSGGEYQPVRFNSFDAPTEDTKIMSMQFANGSVVNQTEGTYGLYSWDTGSASFSGIGENFLDVIDKVNNSPKVSAADVIDHELFGGIAPMQSVTIQTGANGKNGVLTNDPDYNRYARSLFTEDRMKIDMMINGDVDNIKSNFIELYEKFNPKKALRYINEGTRNKAKAKIVSPYDFDDSEGTVTSLKLKSYQPSQAMNLLNDAETVTDLINAGKGGDFVKEAAISWRLVSGIYGYGLGAATGFGVDNQKMIATGQDITSFSRTFWDENLGGLGGSAMEIARRFIPDFRRGNRVNPLMNEMPDWLPDRFRYGDPYCVSKGTLIEVGHLNYIVAEDVQISSIVLSHIGEEVPINNIAIRPVEDGEKVYQLKIASLAAIESKFSENHPILVCNTPEMRRTNPFVKIKIYEQANIILEALSNGVTNKKTLAEISGSNIDDVSRIFKLLYKHGLIYDYHLDKHSVRIKKYEPFDLEMLRHDLVWKKVKDIKPGDYVAYPLLRHDKNEYVVDMQKITQCVSTEEYVYISGTASRQDFVDAYEWLLKNGIPKFAWGERKKFLAKNRWNEKAYENAQSFAKKNITPERISRFIKITPELCYAFGVYLAEGYLNSSGAGFALHKSEIWMFNRVFAAFKSVFPDIRGIFRRIRGTNGACGNIYGKYVGQLLDHLFGHGAEDKKIPDFFWDLPDECILRLAEGYFDGDGCHYSSHGGFSSKKTQKISVASCNLVMLLQFRKLLLRFGVVLSIQRHNKLEKESVIKYTGQKIYSWQNYTAIVRGDYAHKLSLLLWGKADVHKSGRKSCTQTYISGNYVFMRVQENNIVAENIVKEVWGFQVNQGKSFCTAGLATHNTQLPKGEMRLPGKGYESLNELHPDAYGSYGSFDRMKILADIAPFTPEYRMWRDIAKKTVTDPALIEEMAEIRERVNQQGKKHDFYDYQVVGHGLEYKNVVVSEILDYGKFRSGNTIYKLAGASVRGNADENMKEVLGRYIHVGQEVTVAVDEDPYARQNNDAIGSLGAAVFVDGENIALQMIESGDALKRKGDTSAPAILAQYGPLQKGIAYASELLAHVDVPWLSDQFLRVRSPLESYRAEQVYGTPYQSWEHPWDSFIEPAFIRAFHERTAFTGLVGTAYRYMHDIPGMTPGAQKLLGAGYLLSDRGAFIGAAIANFIDPGGRGDTSPKRDWTMRWARHTSAITAAGHVLTGGNSYADEAASAFAVGEEIGRFFEKKRGRAGVIGAAVGVAYRAAFGDEGNSIPGRTKANWEFTDYFDRLTYLKYQRLYKMAAKKAEEEEDVDLEEILEQREKKTEQNRLASSYFKSLKKKLQRNYPDSELRDEMMSTLNERINALEEDKMLLPGGEWTRTALIYKKAADSTMYALKEGASWSEIITALPTNDREYFMEFVKVRDPSKRAAILDTASPFLKKALSLAWGQDVPNQEDNESFFARHELPQENWAGWAPQYDLKDVEVQTIENEALSLSDFGFYESQLRDPDVIDAPSLNYSGTSKGHNEAQVRKNLKAILAGEGLEDVDISVQAGPSGGTTSIIASIKTMMGFRDTQKRVNDSLSMYSA